MIEQLEIIWGNLLLFSFFFSIFCFFAGMIETFLLMRQSGKLKRGFKLSSQPLTGEQRLFLEKLSTTLEEKKELFFRKMTVSFLISAGSERLIQTRRSKWRTSWPYVGYVDLRNPEPQLEFRASIIMHLVLLPAVLSIIAIPFVGLIMFVNYKFETKAIQDFLERQMKLE